MRFCTNFDADKTYLATISFSYSFAFCTCEIRTQQNNLSATHFLQFFVFLLRCLHNRRSSTYGTWLKIYFQAKIFHQLETLQLRFSFSQGFKIYSYVKCAKIPTVYAILIGCFSWFFVFAGYNKANTPSWYRVFGDKWVIPFFSELFNISRATPAKFSQGYSQDRLQMAKQFTSWTFRGWIWKFIRILGELDKTMLLHRTIPSSV